MVSVVLGIGIGLGIGFGSMFLLTKMGFMRKARSAILLRPGEELLGCHYASYKHKKFYASKYAIPRGVVDITDQRLVFTRTSGGQVDNVELEQSEIAGFRNGALFFNHPGPGGEQLPAGQLV